MKLTKMHGLGNDYFYFFQEVPDNVKELAVSLSDRHRGPGSDGLIYICRSDCADFGMRIFNADGSEAKMCGNGIRCVGKYIYDKGLSLAKELTIETQSGIRNLVLEVQGNTVKAVTVDMGAVRVEEPLQINVHGMELELHPVSTGNPHAVVFTDEDGLKLPEQIGYAIERHPLFPDGVNAEFVQVLADNHIRMRVWERGSGVTMACGTGACASAAASVACGYCRKDAPVYVHLDGGVLEIHVQSDGTVRMKGPAEFAYEAEIEMKGELAL